ncbi:MAG: methylmalonyl-CoA mutase family protein [Proteobacteria bacterium]|nr:methylmalonyl-CoA mutase family protein [Pseudomonadota bacterium]
MRAAPPWQEIAVPDDAVAVSPAKKARKARKEPGGKAVKTARKAAIPVRFVTASSLFDGHDASINVMRRILQAAGAEVIHLGHNRSVDDVVTAAVQEDAHAVAVSSYQGGHMEYFRYMIDLLAEHGRADIKVFAGGGGVIVADEASALEAYGVSHVYTPEDGRRLGLQGMIGHMLERVDAQRAVSLAAGLDGLAAGDHGALARVISALENGMLDAKRLGEIRALASRRTGVPVLGVTGTGGSGKSSVVDELIRRFRLYADEPKIAVIAIDPSRRRSGGALLGDRIRMNAISGGRVYMRSMATRGAAREVPACLSDIVAACKAAGFDLVMVETPGIGQGDAGIVSHVDVSLYVMTPEFGAASQLEKIDMLDFADGVAINKFDRKGALDALRDVRKQVQRNREAFSTPADEMPVFGTVASRFNDAGVTALYGAIVRMFADKGVGGPQGTAPSIGAGETGAGTAIVPPGRQHYLAEVAATVRDYHRDAAGQARIARERQQLTAARRMLEAAGRGARHKSDLDALIAEREAALDGRCRALLDGWPKMKERYAAEAHAAKARTTLSGTVIPRVALPRFEDDGELLKWMLTENVPGEFPYTAGVFPFRREGEDPTRMFAGEGDPVRTNKRFKYLSRHTASQRLSTAFDSVTLYGFDPHERPDIYGKVGNSGVSVATLDDMKALYDGFDLCAPETSVSMTINGPAPTILAMFLNTAIDQRLEKHERQRGRPPTAGEAAKIRAYVHENVRGTVQADILKEDQGQNTCIFSIEFALRMMADIQEYFIGHRVRNFYSVSISGYHIAEAGANPISQLAFTLANGFTYVEAYLARGMHVDDFAPNLSFFFSSGMDPEYSVMGRVARRIWATAMRFKYGANERSQRLKYHIQTSGRSLHAQEMDFNDIRTTLQALIAVNDNCNSLHTNAHDEAFTTPTEGSVRRALAIQMIINREWGLAGNENPNQGAFIIEELTELVEEAVLREFESLSQRGGVLGAMETGYQRGKIQDESLHYETLKHDGTLPLVGVNTFVNPDPAEKAVTPRLARSTEREKKSQIKRLRAFQKRHKDEAPAMLARLKQAATGGENVFAVLIEAVRCCSLGQITEALFEAGGQYRRNM